MEEIQEPFAATINAVKRAMGELGLDPAAVSFSSHEKYSWTPGGGYTQCFLRVEARDGRWLDMAAHLADNSPDVAAGDIEHFLRAAEFGDVVTS